VYTGRGADRLKLCLQETMPVAGIRPNLLMFNNAMKIMAEGRGASRDSHALAQAPLPHAHP
jgi:hypothetical protein